jgi:hypothetical protein
MVNNQNKCSNLSVCHLSLSLGIVHGLVFFVVAYFSMFHSGLMPLVKSLELVFPGFASGLVGGAIAFVWGFVSGFVVGALIAFFYNLFNCYCCCNKSCNVNDRKK